MGNNTNSPEDIFSAIALLPAIIVLFIIIAPIAVVMLVLDIIKPETRDEMEIVRSSL